MMEPSCLEFHAVVAIFDIIGGFIGLILIISLTWNLCIIKSDKKITRSIIIASSLHVWMLSVGLIFAAVNHILEHSDNCAASDVFLNN